MLTQLDSQRLQYSHSKKLSHKAQKKLAFREIYVRAGTGKIQSDHQIGLVSAWKLQARYQCHTLQKNLFHNEDRKFALRPSRVHDRMQSSIFVKESLWTFMRPINFQKS
jgi:hypothetical protein